MGTKGWVPLLLLLGTVFLASVSVSVGFAYWEGESPKYPKCLASCPSETDRNRYLACHARCKLINNSQGSREKEEQEEPEQEQQRGQHEEQEEEEQEERVQRRQQKEPQQEQEQERRVERKKQQRHQQQRGQREEEEERQAREERERQQEEEEQESRRQEKERQREQEQERRAEKKQQRQQEEEQEQERHAEKKQQRQQEEEQEEKQQQNPFHFPSHKFQTRFKNQHGRIRILPKFNVTGELQNYRIVEVEARPQTFILAHHSDAEYLVVVVKGKALLTLVDQNNRESYNVEQGEVLRVPAGVIVYAANRDDNNNLRIAKLAIPVNVPGRFAEFYPSGRQNPLSYFTGFSKETLEAIFKRPYEEIERILIGEQEEEQEQGQEQSSEEGLITKATQQQIEELSQHAKSSPRGSRSPFKSVGPFSPRQNKARYSNKYGRFYEARPKDFLQLQDLGISVTYTEINKDALMLPHYNTRSLVLALIVEGKGKFELGAAVKDQEEEQEESSHRQAQTFTAELSQGDALVIPAGAPFVLTASENLRVLGFGLNDENNQRNFLAGENDNVLNQIERQAKELTFPGSGKQVERLLKHQKESYFADATPQEKEERDHQRRSAPLSSILGAFF